MAFVLNCIFKDSTAKKLFWLLSAVLALMIVSGFYSFTAWSQIRFYNLESEALLFPGESNEISIRHFSQYWQTGELAKIVQYPRYLLTKPIFVISELTGIHYNKVFSLIVLLNFMFSALLISFSLLANTKAKEKNINPIFVAFTSFILLSMFMNGRLSFAFFGFSILIFVVIRKWDETAPFYKLCPALFFATWLCSVSSGVFAEIMVFLILLPIWRFLGHRNFNRRVAHSVLACLITLCLGLPWLFMGIIKNLMFYGSVGFGSLMRMVSHGYGAMFPSKIIFAVFIIFVVLSFLWFLAISKKPWFKKVDTFLIMCIILSIMMGVFGYSITTAFFPAYLFLALQWLMGQKTFPAASL